MAAPPAPETVSERDPVGLSRYLLSFRWPYRNESVHQVLVDGGLPLWRQVLRFVPNPKTRGRALELGSPPFHITLLLQRFRNYDLSLTGFAADGRPEIEQTLESTEFAETYTFRCTCFDAEKERFPYDDDTFDLVTWCEVIEHLTENPVHTLAEIHRVLKPGGAFMHVFPSKYSLIEPHVRVPFAGALRARWWMRLWAALGVRNEFQRKLSARQASEDSLRYLGTRTNYYGRRQLRRQFAQMFSDVQFVEHAFLKTSERGRKVHRLSKGLPFLPRLYSMLGNRVVFGRRAPAAQAPSSAAASLTLANLRSA